MEWNVKKGDKDTERIHLNRILADIAAGTLSFEDGFETVSKNLSSSNVTLNYSSGRISNMVYANGITKTFGFTGDKLTSIVLSGPTPDGISLTKTLGYTGDSLTSVSYS